MDVNEVIQNSAFFIEKDVYSIAKVKGNININQCFMVTSDEMEKTAIFPQKIKLDNIIEQKFDYKLIGIDVSLPFEAFGFLSTITNNLARNEIPVLVISTFSRDYLLIKNIDVNGAKDALLEIGLIERII